MSIPLTIICLCYNQAEFLEEAVASVFSQNEIEKQVILVDDASTDNSREVCKRLMSKYDFDEVFLHEKNLGNTKAFNHALRHAKGEYVIDFACDDVFMENAFVEQINCLKLHPNVGMLYSNALFVDENGVESGYQYAVDQDGNAIEKIPSGNVFLYVLKKSYINTPSMVMKRDWLIELGGYNESLIYEDFDIWLRGSLIAPMIYLDKVLVKKRIHSSNSSRNFMSIKGRVYYDSTAKILESVLNSINSTDEIQALSDRCIYEGRNAGFWGFYEEQERFRQILKKYNFFGSGIWFKWKIYQVAGVFLRKRLSKI